MCVCVFYSIRSFKKDALQWTKNQSPKRAWTIWPHPTGRRSPTLIPSPTRWKCEFVGHGTSLTLQNLRSGWPD